MPELPEVEIMARNLHRWMAGRRVVRLDVLDTKFDEASLRLVEGCEVTRVVRRAKYAVLDFSGHQHLLVHYRMTGKTVQDSEGTRRSRLRFVLDEGPPVAFEDPRRFGTCERVAHADLQRFFEEKKLGPEPWPEPRNWQWWKGQLAGLRGPIKTALMRQDRVAGLGNIAASEILFRARIHPGTSVPQVQDDAWIRIADAVPRFIAHTLAKESADEIQYVNLGGEGSFSVYGHAGEECPRCQALVERMTQAGRGTYFCPACQSD